MKVAIIMGSDSDLPIMQEAVTVLKDFGIPVEVDIVSAHRTPEKLVDFSNNAHKRGLLSSSQEQVERRICQAWSLR